MTDEKKEDLPRARIQRRVGKHPMRKAILRMMEEQKMSLGALAVEMRENPETVAAYLRGEATIPLSACLELSTALDMPRQRILHHWLQEYHPDVLQAFESLPGTPLTPTMTLAEARLIRELRNLRTDGEGAELVVVDDARIVGIVLTRPDAE